MTEHTRADQTLTEPRAKLLDLSLSQLIGGSLAAATAAALGSRLGVVGTIVGAAVGSVVTAIAASLYTTSMTRAHRAIVTTWRPARAVASVEAMDVSARDRPASRRDDVRGERLPRARRALASAAAVFVVAAAFLAGFQIATGTPVTGTDVGTRQEAAPPAGEPAAVPPVGEAAAGDSNATTEPTPPTAGPDATSEPAPTQTATPAPTQSTTPPPKPTEPGTEPPATSPGPQTPTTPATPVPSG
jgi:hypothetical protein